MIIEPKFKPQDYIINHASGDMAIIDSLTKKGYYTFKAYYGKMFDSLKDLKNYKYELQVNYQKFWDLCTDEEKKKLDDIISNEREKR